MTTVVTYALHQSGMILKPRLGHVCGNVLKNRVVSEYFLHTVLVAYLLCAENLDSLLLNLFLHLSHFCENEKEDGSNNYHRLCFDTSEATTPITRFICANKNIHHPTLLVIRQQICICFGVSLAVSTPGSIEDNQHVLLLLQDRLEGLLSQVDHGRLHATAAGLIKIVQQKFLRIQTKFSDF